MGAFFLAKAGEMSLILAQILILWRESGTGKFLAGKTHHMGEEHEYKAANMWLWAQCQRPSA